jgi:hypothetical protein
VDGLGIAPAPLVVSTGAVTAVIFALSRNSVGLATLPSMSPSAATSDVPEPIIAIARLLVDAAEDQLHL